MMTRAVTALIFFLGIFVFGYICSERKPCHKGCEYLVQTRWFRNSSCRRDALCRWDMAYYMKNQPGAEESLTGIITTAEAEYNVGRYMKNLPYRVDGKYMKDCKRSIPACYRVWKKLFLVECKRLYPELPQPPPVIPRGTHNKPYLHPPIEDWAKPYWSYEPVKKQLGKAFLYNQTNYMPFTCPYKSKMYSTTMSFLFNKTGVKWSSSWAFTAVGKMEHKRNLKIGYCRFVWFTLYKAMFNVSNDALCYRLSRDPMVLCISHNDPPQVPTFEDTRKMCKLQTGWKGNNNDLNTNPYFDDDGKEWLYKFW